MEISEEEIIDVFRKLGFTTSVKDDVITVSVPRRRIDISIKEDLIEEVGRIYGVNNIKGKKYIIGNKFRVEILQKNIAIIY